MMKNIIAELEALANQIATATTKDGEVLNTIESQQLLIDKLQQAHDLKERQFIDGTVTLEQLQYSQQEIDSESKILLNLERLAESTKKAIKELEEKRTTLNKQLVIAQRQFCTELRNQAIAKIKADRALRQNLIAAIVADVGAGGEYTLTAAVFVRKFLDRILPEINEDEVRGELEKFKKSNELD